MTDLRLRPRFRLEVACNSQALIAAFENKLASSSAVSGSIYHSSCVLKVPEKARHFWSPQLHISIDPGNDGMTVLHGIYGPRPAVWSVFIALYVAVAFVGVMGVIFGYSQQLLGNPADAYWAGPVAIVLSVVIYAVARQGRRLGYGQMLELRGFVDEILAGTAAGKEAAAT